jgi:4-hydroxybenzoyl-CoA thioesterase
MMSAIFESSVRVRFSHCDPAGIVFFPQYLVLTNALVEDWFTQALGIDYAHMIGVRRIGLPIVKLECDFSRPSRMGETITLALSIEKLGRRSVTISIVCRSAEEFRFSARQVLVITSLDTDRSTDVPDDIAKALLAFAQPTGSLNHSEKELHK